jgi:hypothetical protein
LALSNAALEAAAAARSGRYTLADDARQEIGRAVAQGERPAWMKM